MQKPPPSPLKINPDETYNRLVSWIKNRAAKDKMPGIIVGVSGTDSLLVFLAAYHAFEKLGMASSVTAVNFVHPGTLATEDGKITCAGADDKDWFARDIMPWLKSYAPEAHYILDDTIDFSDDNKRWGNIFSRAISDTNLNHGMLGNYRLVAGTRNRSEALLGTYTLLSRAPSIQPIEYLYKTEILDICAHLGVPELALQKSREVDCDCGRFDVQAHYLDELDHYMMVQQGELDPTYLSNMPEDVLSAVRQFYHEERQNNAFREKIPYRPTPMKTVYQGEDIKTALETAQSDTQSVKPISSVTPRIIIDKDADTAHQLVTVQNSQNRDQWLPEAFALMGTEGLANNQISDMLSIIFGAEINKIQLGKLAKITAHIGQYAFSFPAKRFTTQRFGDSPSLIELAGFERQDRNTDMRDPSLPPANPTRDELGVGFVWCDTDYYIELRRSYLLISNLSTETPATLLIRNSSHFFGRDRLTHPAYVSFKPLDKEALLNLDAAQLNNPDIFTPWQNIAKVSDDIKADLSAVELLLHFADDVDLKFSAWLRDAKGRLRFKSDFDSINNMFTDTNGYTALRALLKDCLLKHIAAERGGSPLYLAQLDAGHIAPWQPHRISPVTANTLAMLKSYQDGLKIEDEKLNTLFSPVKKRQLVLMSGPYGDFPVNWT